MAVNTSDKKQQRYFGMIMAVCITVVGLIRWAWHGFHALPLWFFYVAAAFLVLGLVAPRVLQPVLVVWMKFAEALNWVLTRVILGVAFFGMIVPARIILRLAKKDLLNRAWDPNAVSYWEEPEEQPSEFDRYLNQF